QGGAKLQGALNRRPGTGTGLAGSNRLRLPRHAALRALLLTHRYARTAIEGASADAQDCGVSGASWLLCHKSSSAAPDGFGRDPGRSLRLFTGRAQALERLPIRSAQNRYRWRAAASHPRLAISLGLSLRRAPAKMTKMTHADQQSEPLTPFPTQHERLRQARSLRRQAAQTQAGSSLDAGSVR